MPVMRETMVQLLSRNTSPLSYVNPFFGTKTIPTLASCLETNTNTSTHISPISVPKYLNPNGTIVQGKMRSICLAGHLTKKQQPLRKSTKGRIIDHVTLVLCKITADKTFWKVLSIPDFVWKPVKVVWIQRIWGLHAQKQTVCIHLQSEWDLHGWPNPPHTITREFAVN